LTKAELKYYSSLNKRKIRENEGKFLIEGGHLIEEILSSKGYSDNLEKIFIRNDYDNDKILDRLKAAKVEIEKVDVKSIERLSDTKSPQGIVGVVKIPLELVTADEKLILLLENINDPGNLGTILRTAYWFNVSKVVLGGESVDIYNQKVLRSSQGAVFHIPVLQEKDTAAYLDKMNDKGWKIYLTDLSADVMIDSVNFNNENKYLFVFGNEANGISEEILSNEKYERIKIRSYSECESLNVAISTGIVLNEFRSKTN
jgi:RNA methyltransferase, TrmH family